MPHTKKNPEFQRGSREAAFAITTLQERWPAAFPRQAHLVRPLINKVVGPVAEGMGWSKLYALAVLRRWKLRAPYCQAVIAHDRRYDLDGAVTEEIVDDEARELAQRQLAFKAEAKKRRLQESQAKVNEPPTDEPSDVVFEQIEAAHADANSTPSIQP
jgi:sRNA-binding protein